MALCNHRTDHLLWLDIKHLQVNHPALSKVLRGKTEIQISDLHIGNPGKREDRVLRFIEEIRPELIFLNGDNVPWEGDHEPALAFLEGLKAEIGNCCGSFLVY